jgi:hypothetical protein
VLGFADGDLEGELVGVIVVGLADGGLVAFVGLLDTEGAVLTVGDAEGMSDGFKDGASL